MLDFKPITIEEKELYQPYLLDGTEHGCEYSFTNLFLWGRQKATIFQDHMVLFSQFNRRSVYPFPRGTGDKKPILDAIISDAQKRGIPCRITGLNEAAIQTIDALYPGQFRFHPDRDSYDYVYAIDDLADLKGSKYQKKRNHLKQFQKVFPEYSVCPISESNLSQVQEMLQKWYEQKLSEAPDSDFYMEQAALNKAFKYYKELEFEGLALMNEGQILAFTLGSPLSENTFDIHFEKALAEVNGAYAAINYEFARYIREKYPQIQFLNREEDMGLEGLRIAKERYYPHHMVEKSWACLLEDAYEY